MDLRKQFEKTVPDWQAFRSALSRLRAPAYARCAWTGCNRVATHGYLTRYSVNHVCREHLPEVPVAGLQELGERWWEEDV